MSKKTKKKNNLQKTKQKSGENLSQEKNKTPEKEKPRWPIRIVYSLEEQITSFAKDAASKIISAAPNGIEWQVPEVAIVCGTGMQEVLGNNLDLEVLYNVSFEAFMPFPISPPFQFGHRRELVVMRHKPSGKIIIVSYGRIHYYETQDQHSATFLMRIFHSLGCKQVVLLSAVGGIRRWYHTGDLVLVAYGHLNTMPDPRIGLHPVSFLDPVPAYSDDLRLLMEKAARAQDLRYYVGILADVTGYGYEDWPQRALLAMIGADIASMSNFNEAIVAFCLGIKTVGIGVVTDLIWRPEPVDPAVIGEEMQKAKGKLDVLLVAYLRDVLGGPELLPQVTD